MNPVPSPLGSLCGDGAGAFGNICSLLTRDDAQTTAPIEQMAAVISTVVGVITIVAAFFFLFQFLIGGFNWISSAGDKQRLETAQSRISQGIIGLVVVVAAYGIMTIISSIIGFDFLNPVQFINTLVF